MSLGLPPVSVGLKGIAPFLQRAEELVEREPIIAYWCTFGLLCCLIVDIDIIFRCILRSTTGHFIQGQR